jgi:hypothetical protein
VNLILSGDTFDIDIDQGLLKGTVSPDIGFYLMVYKMESVPFVGLLMVFTFFYFVDHEILTILF